MIRSHSPVTRSGTRHASCLVYPATLIDNHSRSCINQGIYFFMSNKTHTHSFDANFVHSKLYDSPGRAPPAFKPNPLATFLLSTIFKNASRANPLVSLTKSVPLTLPAPTARCRHHNASFIAASSAHRFHSCCAATVGATSTSSMLGTSVVLEVLITASQSCIDLWRIASFVARTESRDCSWASSAFIRLCASCRAAFCARNPASAEVFCSILALIWATRVLDSMANKCSFSGFGGIGGGGPAVVDVGRETSNGSVRRSTGGRAACLCCTKPCSAGFICRDGGWCCGTKRVLCCCCCCCCC